MSIADKIGINLDAQTGYNTEASLDYKIHTGRQLCGLHDDPPGSPGLLVYGEK